MFCSTLKNTYYTKISVLHFPGHTKVKNGNYSLFGYNSISPLKEDEHYVAGSVVYLKLLGEGMFWQVGYLVLTINSTQSIKVENTQNVFYKKHPIHQLL